MKREDKDTTIADIHRIREQIAAKFGGDPFAINADARARMEQSGRPILRRAAPPKPASAGGKNPKSTQ